MQCLTHERKLIIVHIGSADIVLDLLTDTMILSLPIALLWKVNLRTNQKIVIGIFLCLSAVMMALAIIRAAGKFDYYYSNVDIDNTWMYLWQQCEASAAIAMFSLTAFRSVFVSNTSRPSNDSPWKASMPRFAKRFRRSSLSSQDLRLHDVSIPRPTMTGMRTATGSMEDDIISVEPPHSDHTVWDDEPVR